MKNQKDVCFISDEVKVLNILPKKKKQDSSREILTGLISRPRYVSPKYFYDSIGSKLFEEITQLDEYYPSRCEKEILSELIDSVDIDFENLSIVDLGSGDPSKIIQIFQQIPAEKLQTISYIPVDISQSALEESASLLSLLYNLREIKPIVADFCFQLNQIRQKGKQLYCFFGSTIGNFTPQDAHVFLSQLNKVMTSGDSVLIGVDLLKNSNLLELAYNDNKDLTADFNKNILSVVNQYLGSDFDKENFYHKAFFNPQKSRIEMHLVASEDVTIYIPTLEKSICMKKGESIHTENSYKYSLKDINKLAECAELKIAKILTDENKYFGLVHMIKA